MSTDPRPEIWLVTYVKEQDVVAAANETWFVKRVGDGEGVPGTDSQTPVESLGFALTRATERGLHPLNVFPLGYEIVIVLSPSALRD